MKKRVVRRTVSVTLLLIFLLTLITPSPIVPAAFADNNGKTPTKGNIFVSPGSSYAIGEILVKAKKGRSIEGIHSLMGVKKLGMGRGGVQRLKLAPGTDLFTALFRYGSDPSVEYVEPNYARKYSFIPNDPDLVRQWGIDTAQLKPAWDYSRGSSSVVVAVVDSGIDVNHPDLSGKIINPYNSVTKTTGLSQVKDEIGHGSHVAGIAAASTNNGIGIAGVGGDVKIMPVKVSAGETLYDDDIANGIYWAVDNGARVINLSLGGTDISVTLSDAVKYAISRNVVVVAAAGNEETSLPNYPAAYDGVMGVAATTQTDARASFSNYGSYIDVSAPGVNIYSTTPTYPVSYFASNYDYADGTSMASPAVAGLAGLVLSAKPSLTQAQVTELIATNARDLGSPAWDELYGWGRIDAYKTMQAVFDTQPPTAVSTDPVNNAANVSLSKSITVTFNERIQPGANINNVTLKDGAGNSVQLSSGVSGNLMVIDPLINLKGSTPYNLAIPAGAVKDTVGNALVQSLSISFTTKEEIASSLIELPFASTDAVADPDLPVVYISSKSENKVYSVNYKTGATSSLTFDLMPESLEIGKGQFAGELYVALLTREHDSQWDNSVQTGKVAVIDRQSFTSKGTFDVSVDPYDLVAGRDGHLYIPSGSGQWTNMDSYNLATKQRTARSGIRQQSPAALHPTLNRIYTVTTDSSPRDHHAYNITAGTFVEPSYPGGYDSPYHGDYPMSSFFAIDPTGTYLFNGSGYIFRAYGDRTQDMTFIRSMNETFSGIAFDPDFARFYTLPTGVNMVKIYKGNDFTFTDEIALRGRGKILFRQGADLVALTEPVLPTPAFKSGLEIFAVAASPQPSPQPTPDTTAPTGTIQVSNNNAYTNTDAVQLGLTAVDNLGTVESMQFSNDGTSWTAWEPYSPLKAWTLPAGDGIKNVYVRFRDTAGNESFSYSDSIILDTSKPTVNGMTVPAYSKLTTFRVSWTGSDPVPGAGMASYDIEFRPESSSAWTPWINSSTATSADFTGSAGTYYFRARAKDNAGNTGDWTTGTFKSTIDGVAPTVTNLSIPEYSTQLSKNTTFKVSWGGSDPAPGSGIASYTIEYRTAGTTVWTPWKTNFTGTYAYLSGTAGSTYYFRLKATDKAGNTGNWITSAYRTIVPYDANAMINSKTGFTGAYSNSTSSHFLGTLMYSTLANNQVTYRFTGNKFALIGFKGTGRSKAKIYVDGVYVTTIETYSATSVYRAVLFSKSWTTSGVHTVKVVNLGTAGRTRLDLDAVAVGR